MNVKEFQKKLIQIVSVAKGAGNKISTEQVEKHFLADLLSKEQMEKVYEYLVSQKIQVAGYEKKVQQTITEEAETPSGASAADVNGQACVKKTNESFLSGEEESYLKKYRETLKQLPPAGEDMEILLAKAVAGEEAARQKVIEHYMPVVVEIAVEMHQEQVPLADTISEGNVHLIMAVNRLVRTEGADALIKKGIRDGIQYMLEEQTEQKRQDNSMVDKVSRLEAAIKDLTDGDDDLEFSIDELSVFLDMSREEIEDILRLVGEDK